MGAELVAVELPEFGEPTVEPELPDALYAARLERTRARMAAAGLDALAVYGDREHAANLAWLTGYDPRFEEALLIVRPRGNPTLLVGNEGLGYAALARIGLEAVLCQTFSLPGQPRDTSPRLQDSLRAVLGRSDTVGAVGWKLFDRRETAEPATTLDLPAFVADTLRGRCGRVVNATGLFMAAGDGLRAENEREQLARFEFAACHTSSAVARAIRGLEPGITEYQLVRRMGVIGLPLSCHLMLSAGPRAAVGLGSPSSRPIGAGEPFTVGYGVWGALNCRAGWVARGPADLPEPVRDYVERLVRPYFEAIAEWYATVGIGVPGGELHEVIQGRLGDAFFGIGLNPGHLIGLDEWVNSPIYPGSTEPLRSGMALQVDVIPATGTAYFTTNIEDGIALLDEPGRDAFAARFPEAWVRIQARRAFMQEVLGLKMKPEVLPFSNLAAWLPPFLLDRGRAMAMRG